MGTVTADLLRASGLGEEDGAAWSGAAPAVDPAPGGFADAAASTSAYLQEGERLLTRLPARPRRSATEQAAAAAILEALHAARERLLRAHAERLHAAVCPDPGQALRIEGLLERLAERWPGLVPTTAQVAAEREVHQGDKDGLEIAQGLAIAHVLAAPRAGAHLVWSMRRPLPQSAELLERLRTDGVVDLGGARVTRRGRSGVLELCNERHLNAEDDSTIPPTELGVDLVLLDEAIEVGVMRGAVVDHPRYAGRRIFGSGINLTHLYQGKIAYLFFPVRELGFIAKIHRGLTGPEHHPGVLEEATEKLWIAAAETFAIGGACQLLHVMDHVIADRGCRLYLPARKEGIIPGASNLRLAGSVGDRIARQAILSGREFVAGEPDADMLCDEVVEVGAMDAAIDARVDALTSSGLVNAVANRRALRLGSEPLDTFREYIALYAREQAFCHFSPALVANLERNWKAHERTV